MKSPHLRSVLPSDIDLLYTWANDPVVRSNSFNTSPISYEDHQKWFNRIMTDPSVIQFILEDEEKPIGQIRLTIQRDIAEIGYSIAPEFRGRGYGHKILQLVLEETRKNYPQIKKLTAKVKPCNTVSGKLFESEGYTLAYSCYGLDIKH